MTKEIMVTVPQRITGDFSETGCFGKPMTLKSAIITYGEKAIRENCRLYMGNPEKMIFFNDDQEEEIISSIDDSENLLAKWGY